MRIAAVAPANYDGYWLGRASRELLRELSRLAEVEVFLFRNAARPESSPGNVLWWDVKEFQIRCRRPPGYDVNLFLVGNDAFYCEQAYLRHLYRPGGVACLFDETLQHFVQTISVYRGDSAHYRRTMTQCHGEAGRLAADLILTGQGNEALFVEYDCLKTFVEMASGLVCTSRHLLDRASRYVEHCAPETTVLPLWLDAAAAITDAPAQGKAGPARLRVLCLPGQTKSVLTTLLAWAASERARKMGVVVCFEAQDAEKKWLRAETARADSNRQVELADPAAGGPCEVVVDLRLPWEGEKIRNALQRMASGEVLVLGDYPEVADFPDEACLRIPFGPRRDEVLWEVLSGLAGWPERRRAMGQNAREFVRLKRSPRTAAHTLHAFLVGRAQALGEKAAIQRGHYVEKRRQETLIFEKTLRDSIHGTLFAGWDGWPAGCLSRTLDGVLTEIGLGRKGPARS